MKFCQSCGSPLNGQEIEDLDRCASCIDSEATTNSVRKSILTFWNNRIEVENEDGDSLTLAASE